MEFIEHWHSWLTIAFLVLIIELMSGTYFLLAIAGGAFLTSMLSWWLQPSITIELLIFALSSAASYTLLLFFRKKKSLPNTDGTTHMLGQHVEVIEGIESHGRVRYKGVIWQAESTELLKKGEFAKIIAVHGSTLSVSSIQKTTGE